MTRKTIFLLTALIAVLFLVGVASASHITIGNVNVASGGTATADVILDSVDPINGTSGYIIQLDIADPSVAQITGVSYNTSLLGLTNMPDVLPFTSGGKIDWTDTNYVLSPTTPGSNFVLCTLTFQGLSAGTTTLNPTYLMFDGEEEVWGEDLIPTSSIDHPTITVTGPPTAAFAANANASYVGATTTFTDASTGNPTSWAWTFGDGATSTLQNPTHVYTTAGTYDVSLTATNAAGSNTLTKTGYMVVSNMPVPVAAFTSGAMMGSAPLSVTFADASTNTPDAWNWEYRLNSTSGAWTSFSTPAVQNPTQSFAAGAYDIRLTATNAGGSSTKTKTQFLTVSAGAKPLSDVNSGTVSGDLYVGTFGPFSTGTSYVTNTAEETFSLPAAAVGNVQWARLYTVVYGSQTDNRTGTAVVSFDSNGDGTYETVLGTETLTGLSDSTAKVYPVNDHVDKQYTDYQIQYDATSLITSASPKAKVVTSPVSTNFDGRIKDVVLVVAYNDGDSDVVKYWVKDGFDFQTSTASAETATFATSALTTLPLTATLENIGLASQDAIYTFNSNSLSRKGTVGTSVSYENNIWNVTSYLTAGSDSSFVYQHNTSTSFKTTLAVLKARYVTPPTAAFTADRGIPSTNAAPVNSVVTFTSTSTVPNTNIPATYAWDFKDGAVSTLQNPTHTFTAAGIYNVTLTVTNEGGSSTVIHDVYVTDKPIISIAPSTQTFNPSETATYVITMDSAPQGLAGYDMVVSLSDGTKADITSVTYDTNWAQMTLSPTVPADSVRIGAVDTQQKIYPGTTGPYTLATITVKGVAAGSTNLVMSSVNMDDDSGASIGPNADAVGIANIGTYAGPTASFTGTPLSGNAPLTVAFDSSASTGTITTYQWDFDNDGTIDSTDASPSHTYSTIGTYAVKLVVSGPGGSNTLLRNAYITVGDGTAPTVTVVADKLTGNYPLTVGFSATTTGNITSYAWNFGDSVYSTLAAPSHTYTYPGTFTTTLTVTGPGGSATDTETIVVTQDAPVAAIIANPTSGTSPLLVQFTDASTGSITSYNWSFGDGAYSDAASPSHTFTSAGVYTVSHVVTGPGGVSNTATTTITVTGLGVSFTADTLTGVASAEHGFTTAFTSTLTPASGSATYNWSFGDGTYSTDANPSHTYYGHLKSFTVTLTAISGADIASVTRTNYISITPYLEAFPKYDTAGTITGYYSQIPADLDGDYVYEDINHNGRSDYDDVVAFYGAYTWNWFTTNTDVDNAFDYDYSGNGALGYNDVVVINDMVVY